MSAQSQSASQVCDCGKGYRSAYDGKCGHCRTAKERRHHWWLIHKDDRKTEGRS